MKTLSNFYQTMKTSNSILWYAISAALPAAFLLLVPLVAMQYSGEVNWSPFDFAAAFILLFGAGFTYKLISGKINNKVYKAACGLAVAAALFLIWANLAVGLVGSEDNSFNQIYLGVLAVGLVGALIARFQPKGMSLALAATALAQALTAVIALIAGMHLIPGSSVREILVVNGFFTFLWAGSALLFRYAALVQSKS